MRTFLSGSYRYGTPKSTSDIDLVVLITKEELEDIKKGPASAVCAFIPPDKCEHAEFELAIPFPVRTHYVFITDPDKFTLWASIAAHLAGYVPFISKEEAKFIVNSNLQDYEKYGKKELLC